jgi:dCTP deaminase
MSAEYSPSHPQAVPDAIPTLGSFAWAVHVLCSVCARTRTRPAAATAVLNFQPTSDGVLPGQLLERAIRAGYVDAGRFNIPETNVQPASLDLRLGERALRIRCSFLPGTDSVERKLKDYILDEIDLRGDGAMLEARCPYLIELKERLDLPAGLRGKANPKSSTGRIDVFTRVITDNSDRFDEVAPGYSGPLYLEVVPLSFAVRVREDLTLNQLRLSIGRPWLSDDEVRQTHLEEPILYKAGMPVPVDDLVLSNGLFLGLDLRGDERGQVGHSTRDSAPLLDLTSGAEVDPMPFWDPVFREDGDRLVLSPKRFYLLMSNEAVSIPPNLAAEMTAYDPTSGELRTHYAGFFDPGFGFDPTGGFRGSRAALEVRAHDVPFMVENGQAVCKLTFERMLEEPTSLYGSGIGSSYQQQEETLSRYFRRS